MTTTIEASAERLFTALNQRVPIDPLIQTTPSMTLADAYAVSKRILDLRLTRGEQITGKKIGITSKAVQDMLKVDQPDFGFLTDNMAFVSGATINFSEHFLQPRIEGEMAFLLKSDLKGPGVTASDVLAATEAIAPCFEIVDSRIRNWEISIVDTIADNASCGAYLVGEPWTDLDTVDFENIELTVSRDEEEISRGRGSDVLGTPLGAVAWLANTLGEYGITLKAGEVILSGSFGPLVDVQTGHYVVTLHGIGDASVTFI